jgi:ferric-dicitrate binding protein FerR (iron transport regulator)
VSTSITPQDAGTPPGPAVPPALPDEEALHQLVLSDHASLLTLARSELGPDAAGYAQRVTERAFIDAWDARLQFHTPDEVHGFLAEDVRHGAARALSQQALAHRFATHAHDTHAHDTHAHDPHVTQTHHAIVEVSAADTWRHIEHALHGGAHQPDAMEASLAASRHEAAEHIAHVEQRGHWWIAAAVIVVAALALFGVMRWLDRASAESRIAQAVNGTDVRTLTSVAGQIGDVTLGDGSTVRLAPESKLTIPQSFGPDLRGLRLDGAAAFTVAPENGDNFTVFAGPAVVVATGTAFTVRAYSNDPDATIVVTKGTVRVHRGADVRDVRAGEALVVPERAPMRVATATERDAADAWRTGTIAITNERLGDVLTELRRWYALDIHVQHPPLLDRRVTVRAPLGARNDAIHAIEQSSGLEFGYVDSTMVLREPAHH